MNHERATTPALFVTARQWGCRPAFYQTDPLRDKPPNTNHQFDWMCNQNTNTRLQKSKLFWRQRVALLVFSLTIFILFLSISVNLSTPSIVSSLRNWCDQGFWLQVFHAWKKIRDRQSLGSKYSESQPAYSLLAAAENGTKLLLPPVWWKSAASQELKQRTVRSSGRRLLLLSKYKTKLSSLHGGPVTQRDVHASVCFTVSLNMSCCIGQCFNFLSN